MAPIDEIVMLIFAGLATAWIIGQVCRLAHTAVRGRRAHANHHYLLEDDLYNGADREH